MEFEYYEVRPCIQQGISVSSYTDRARFIRAVARHTSRGEAIETFWTLYGIGPKHGIEFAATAIGDFATEDAAHGALHRLTAADEVMDALVRARNLLERSTQAPGDRLLAALAWAILDDVINQSTNDDGK